jgi:hypothetical protein
MIVYLGEKVVSEKEYLSAMIDSWAGIETSQRRGYAAMAVNGRIRRRREGSGG